MTTTETELDKAFNIFQLNFRHTRLIRNDENLVYTIGGNDLQRVVDEANELIKKLELPLVAERNKNSQVLFNTVVVRERK